MDELSLREKLDAIEACDRLIAYHTADLEVAIKEENEGLVEGIAGPDYSSPVRERIAYYKKLRTSLIRSLENDNVLLRAEESLNIGPRHR